MYHIILYIIICVCICTYRTSCVETHRTNPPASLVKRFQDNEAQGIHILHRSQWNQSRQAVSGVHGASDVFRYQTKSKARRIQR